MDSRSAGMGDVRAYRRNFGLLRDFEVRAAVGGDRDSVAGGGTAVESGAEEQLPDEPSGAVGGGHQV